MTATTTRRAYWIATSLFALAMLADAYGGLSQAEAGQESLRHLGYPLYLLTIMGVAKLLGVVAVLQTRFRTIKEWAYAGFAINCLGAFASRWFVGDGAGPVVLPLVFLAITLVPYYFWKKLEAIRP